MECRAYGICLDSQSRGYRGKDRKVSSAAGGNLSRMHKTEETAKESRLNFMYSHLRNRTLATYKIPKRQSRAGCALGMLCSVYVRFFLRRETLPSRHQPRRRLMLKGKFWSTL